MGGSVVPADRSASRLIDVRSDALADTDRTLVDRDPVQVEPWQWGHRVEDARLVPEAVVMVPVSPT